MELKAFTVRLPETLIEQLDARAGVNRRKRNQEIQYLLEQAIDTSVASDLEVIQKMGQ